MAQELCLSAGLTGVHDAGVSPRDIEVYQRLKDDGRLKLRMYLMVSGPYAMRYFDSNEPIIDERLAVRAAKLYMDGAMGSRGAWLYEPYADRAEDEQGMPYTGLAVSDPEFIEAVARHALERGYQVCTHAIGDRGNGEVLRAYELALRSLPGFAEMETFNHRFRIEHAQLLRMDDINSFPLWGIIASMQPTHCTSDMRWVEARVGPMRARGAYAWRTLLDQGAIIAGGSDFPVESHNPFLGFYAAVTRQDLQGNPEGGWMPRERLTREQALHLFTLGAAYASFEEDRKGSLETGKLADFIVIDRDVMTCDEREIPETKVLRTVIGGETVYERRP
jgi:predicted amidohydrolase YtcJ